MATASAVERALVELAGSDVTVGVRTICADDIAGLYPSELEVIARAVDRRRAEFATGRALLRQLLGTSCPVLPGPSRAPVLPDGVVGSLAHDRGLAVAALTHAPNVRAIGIDIEPAEQLAPDLARVILREDERGIDPHLAFTVKEAVYKAWSVLGGSLLEHHDVVLTQRTSSFDAVVWETGWAVTASYATVAGRHLALVVVRDDCAAVYPGTPNHGVVDERVW